MPSILITGGAGFIGSHIAATLSTVKDCRVIICDVFGEDEKWRNLARHAVYEIIPPANLFMWLEMFGDELDAIIHMGAISSTVERNVDFILDNNLSLSTLLWRWCSGQGKRFIYASSAATYGNGSQGFSDAHKLTDLRKFKPMNPYGWSKHLFDLHIAQVLDQGTMAPPQWAGLKFFNVYGPNEYHKGGQASVVYQMFPDAMEGNAVRLFKSHRADYKDGAQKRDFVHVSDCVKVVLWLLNHPEISGIFNVGTGAARSFDDLASALFSAAGKPRKVEYIDMPEGLREQYQYFTQADISGLRNAGYTDAFITLETGVKDYVQNYLMKLGEGEGYY